jgi:DNA-binding NarL/FixJ family response regulator
LVSILLLSCHFLSSIRHPFHLQNNGSNPLLPLLGCLKDRMLGQKQTKILVADDHELIRQGVQVVLQRQPGWEVCGQAATGREAVEKAKQLKPDVVIMDYSMPDLNGLEATRQIRDILPETEVLILTVNASEELARGVLNAGARGFILKSDVGRVMVDAIKAVLEERTYITSKISGVLSGGELNLDTVVEKCADGTLLTPREREVVQLITEGKSTKEAADVLGISTKTADTHRTNIMRKLNLHSVSDLVRYAIRNRIIEP